MSDHDPLCTTYYPDLIAANLCSRCELIKRARLDEREKTVERIYVEAEDSNVLRVDDAVAAIRFPNE